MCLENGRTVPPSIEVFLDPLSSVEKSSSGYKEGTVSCLRENVVSRAKFCLVKSCLSA
jgi:hypothetical protein